MNYEGRLGERWIDQLRTGQVSGETFDTVMDAYREFVSGLEEPIVVGGR